MKLLERLRRVGRRVWFGLLKLDYIRHRWCRWRWWLYNGRLRVLEDRSVGVPDLAVRHNLGAFAERAVFGMGNRMSLVLYPLVASLRHVQNPRVLIVGPRTEDDIFWAMALGLHNTSGLDLLSYSPLIELGDIHRTTYPDNNFDAVVLGWMITYSSTPEVAIAECKRILKAGGLLAIGIEGTPPESFESVRDRRINSILSTDDLVQMTREPVVYRCEPRLSVAYDCAVIFQVGEPTR